ncbi:phage tail protein [Croceicoccus sp. BE223]|uniref:GTA baseplate fiber-binding domain-containing protein n=1 Tax=Croceicoccus sp. BE223 TaxID=2817716 RepID=UPI002861860A|nr:phage tail protein [Croceicoccus sp. BE223]MDR7102802.1 hypothetical protein [Croceicoccus sp. BE223]
MAGRALDGAVIGSRGYQGPRLKELAVTTSSYGSNIPRHFGKVRAAGSVIWATDLVEHKENSGGGKGKPKVTSYSYTASFAVALASRRIARVGRVWADGNLLRGAAEDLKVGGSLRVHEGADDQLPDPLIEADLGPGCPAFRGMAYAVFEDLDLSDFGNRIPALTFEIIADESGLTLRDLLPDDRLDIDPIELALSGFSHDGGADADLVAELDTFFPISCDGGGGRLSLRDASTAAGQVVAVLPPPVSSTQGEFAARTGLRRDRTMERSSEGVNLRYYDTGRDYQPGMQRSRGRPGTGRVDLIEFPACLDAGCARELADKVVDNRESSRETMSYRIATLDPALRCGSLVRPFGERGVWRVRSWEWRSSRVELELEALPTRLAQGVRAPGDPGQTKPPADVTVGTTILTAFEAPWDGIGSGSERRIMVAASSADAGWRGTALFADRGDGQLIPAGTAGRQRATVGVATQALPLASPHLLDRQSTVVIQLADPSFALTQTDIRGLALGANQARLGQEIIQFADAEPVGPGLWRLSSLLRGRGGTEHAIAGHVSGEAFVLIDDTLAVADELAFGSSTAPRLVAIGPGDTVPVAVPVDDFGATLRPLAPVKAVFERDSEGLPTLRWTRRSRGGWQWLDAVDAPLAESMESYEVRFVDGNGRVVSWRVGSAEWQPSVVQWSELSAGPLPHRLEIRQIGSVSMSRPLIVKLTTA